MVEWKYTLGPTTVQRTATNFIVYSVPALIQKHLAFVNFSKWKGNKLRIKVCGIEMIKTKEIYTMYTMKWVVISLEYIFIPPWLIIYKKQYHSSKSKIKHIIYFFCHVCLLFICLLLTRPFCYLGDWWYSGKSLPAWTVSLNSNSNT